QGILEVVHDRDESGGHHLGLLGPSSTKQRLHPRVALEQNLVEVVNDLRLAVDDQRKAVAQEGNVQYHGCSSVDGHEPTLLAPCPSRFVASRGWMHDR